jgi:hypothetical protein
MAKPSEQKTIRISRAMSRLSDDVGKVHLFAGDIGHNF